MKRLLCIIVGILAFLMVFMSFNEININQGTNLHLIEQNVAKSNGDNVYFVSIYDEDKSLINDLVDFGNNHKVSYFISDSYKDDACLYTIFDNYIFSSDKDILDIYDIETKDVIDFSKLSNKYYSSEDDNNSSGKIRILDNGFFDRNLEIHRFKSLGSYDGTGLIYFRIVCKEATFNEFSEWISERYNLTDNTEGMSKAITYEDHEVVSNQVKELLQIGIFLFAVIMAIIVIKKQRAYMIQRMMGISAFRIELKEFGGLFVFLVVDFIVVCAISFLVLCKENSASKTAFMFDIIGFTGLFVLVLLLVWLLIGIFIKAVSSIKYLNTNQSFNKLFYIQAIIRVIVTVILITPIMQSIDNVKPFISNYWAVKDMKDKIANMYSLEYIPDESREIYNDYYDQAYYSNFSSYYGNYRLLEEEDTSEEDVYPYPFIRVNDNYLSDYDDIYDLDGNKLDLNDFKNNTLMVPEDFKDGDLSMYLISNEDIVYIKNTGKYYNYKLEEPFVLTNPIIYLEREYSFETEIQSYFFKTDDIKELQDELSIYSKIDGDMKLISTQYRYDYFNSNLYQEVIELGLLILVYVIMLVILIIQAVLVYFNEHGKLIGISYSLGRSMFRRYLDLLIVDCISYAGIFIAGYILKVKSDYLMIFLGLLLLGDILISFSYSRYLEKQKLVPLLKGER